MPHETALQSTVNIFAKGRVTGFTLPGMPAISRIAICTAQCMNVTTIFESPKPGVTLRTASARCT
jgi:hypothetical protein